MRSILSARVVPRLITRPPVVACRRGGLGGIILAPLNGYPSPGHGDACDCDSCRYDRVTRSR